MTANIPFLINNTDELNLLCSCEEQEFKDFLKNKNISFWIKIKDEFDTKPNFEGRLTGYLGNIIRTKNFIKNLSVKNQRHELIVSEYESTYKMLQSKYGNMYPIIFLNNPVFSFFENIKANSEQEKMLNDAVKKMNEKYKIAGTEEYFKYNKLNEVFKNYNYYKIFFDYTELFKKDNKYEFNHTDGSYLYRKMSEKKYIIDSVSEKDFRLNIYDKFVPDFEKLKVMSACQSIYRDVIFGFVEKQNRSQKSFLSS